MGASTFQLGHVLYEIEWGDLLSLDSIYTFGRVHILCHALRLGRIYLAVGSIYFAIGAIYFV